MAEFEDSALGQILGLVREYVDGVTVAVQSNLLPEIPVYSGKLDAGGGSSGGGAGGPKGLADLLGIRAGVVVRDARGKVVAKYGDPAPIDPLRAGVLALLVLGVGYVFLRGLTR